MSKVFQKTTLTGTADSSYNEFYLGFACCSFSFRHHIDHTLVIGEIFSDKTLTLSHVKQTPNLQCRDREQSPELYCKSYVYNRPVPKNKGRLCPHPLPKNAHCTSKWWGYHRPIFAPVTSLPLVTNMLKSIYSQGVECNNSEIGKKPIWVFLRSIPKNRRAYNFFEIFFFSDQEKA